VQSRGYFVPSHSYDDWTSALQTKKSNESLQVSQKSSAMSVNDVSDEPIEEYNINDIMDLLIYMVVVLQELAVAQANRLTFYTDYQNAYTQLQGQIPYLSEGEISLQKDEDNAAFTNSFNQNIASVLNQDLQAERGIQEDNASKQQTYLNTTTQAVNDTSNQLNAFMDLLGRMRDSIFR
jgi:hypothetical protein